MSRFMGGTTAAVVSQTEPTPERGKIWFEPVPGGVRLYKGSTAGWGGVGFVRDIPDANNLHMRYDAVDQDATNGPVSTITDHTGNGNDLTGSAEYQESGFNNRPTFDFDPSTPDNMTVGSLHQNLAEPYTIYLVSRLDDSNTNNNHSPWAQSNSSGPRIRTRAGGEQQLQDSNGSGIKYADTDLQPHIEMGLFDGSDSLASRGDVSDVSGSLSPPSLSGFALASTIETPWDGAISACWVYDAAHNEETQNAVVRSLIGRYNI